MKSATARSGDDGAMLVPTVAPSLRWVCARSARPSGPSLRSLEQPTNPFRRRFHPVELEEIRHLGGIEDEVGRTDLEHLATHSSSAAGEPHVPAARDDQLDMIRQEIEEQTHRVTAVA